MTTTALSEVRPLGDSVPVRFRNRMFPQELNADTASRFDVPEIETNDSDQDIENHLQDDLWQCLPFVKCDAASETEQLIQTYVDSLSQLQVLHNDAKRLMRALCEASLEFQQGTGPTNETARDEALAKKLDEMTAKADLGLLPPRNVLTHELVSEPAHVLYSQLHSALIVAVRDFVSQLFTGLERLTDRGVVGLIDWVDGNNCRYHFFREVIVQENDGTTEIVEATIEQGGRNDLFSEAFQRPQPSQRIVEETSGRHIHRHARHEHHVMKAYRTSIKNSRVVMPPNVKEMLRHIPDWLDPYVRIVDGTLFRELIVAREYRVDTWKDSKPRDEPVFGFEPAVVIGQFVLTGWGPREVEAELDRRRELASLRDLQREIASASWQRIAWSAASVMMLVLSFILTWQAYRLEPMLTMPSMAAFLFSIWAFVQAIRSHAIASQLKLLMLPITACLTSFTLFGIAVQAVATSGVTDSWTLDFAPFLLIPIALFLAFVGGKSLVPPTNNNI